MVDEKESGELNMFVLDFQINYWPAIPAADCE
jgi:hypothetical protein